jgi:hypothetical protein
MRFFEFVENDPSDKLIVVLRNYIGRAASKGAGSQLNWNGLNKIFQTSGVELAADYETFKAIYDSNPVVQSLVKDFNQDGINLNVPGAPDDQEQSPQKSGETSQDQVDKMAASAAPQQLAAQA